jgi:cell division transport system ATP-binding protein
VTAEPAPSDAAPATAHASSALIELEHVSKSYVAGTWALHDVSCTIEKGEFVFLTGASGAGKTTLLRLLFAAERPNEGRIRVLGRAVERMGARDVARLRRRIGVVFQDFKLLPRHTVEENVRIALDVAGVPGGEARARSFAALKQVGLQHRRHHAPLSLSGGEQQRVAIARALVNEPDLLLADEPTGNLDPALTVEIFDLIAGSAARGTTVVVATHDPAVLERYRRRTLRLEGGHIAEDRPAAGTRR